MVQLIVIYNVEEFEKGWSNIKEGGRGGRGGESM